jgi:hypothetical protein
VIHAEWSSRTWLNLGRLNGCFYADISDEK